ncbi:MAG: RNA polymerase sigma factor [bacterium]|nr:RNA polymerase sigma factor [bacterium]
MKSDKEIMLKIRDGDLEKLRIIYDRYKVKLYNYYYRLTFNSQLSEDLVQDLFVKLIKYSHTYRGEGVFTTWLFQIAHNIFRDHIRKNRPTQDVDDLKDRLPDEDDVEENLEASEDIRILKKAFKRLPEQDREILTMSRYQNMKYEEIAGIMDCAVGTIKSRVHYALKNLRTEYFQLSNEALL